jgi:azurin
MRGSIASIAIVATVSAHAAEAVKLELSADDRMVFSKTSFEVVSGQKVTLVFKNTGTKGEKSMKHNVVLLKPGNTIVSFAVKCNAAAETGYVPADKESKEQMVGHVKLLGGGQTGTLTFTAGEPGEYPFFCSSPGHFDKMKGKITVKAK